ncbi:ABC transporter ATP-binding protein [Saccharothrix australiensis]|uniref:Putative ABC transport system ATP-binding protein/macrolide transport system ATP-binding/permease protein n=1 Tax=Saccharothrix australiensis TaxID=2072 RepID=A0A495W557_9PSEU|nr:ATP-binding cassette domain-containing protein [Saccharothrix australiensis]RKT56187.1 putative ABC transport system ATP-binding protein/macrolide transport system ATP-binding/permease protein [Saccharothrix australiensis]
MAERHEGRGTAVVEHVLRLREVGVDYPTPAGSVTAVSDVSLDVPARGLTVLAGPSGSGKSTLLRVLSLVERPTRGGVELRGAGTTGLSSKARRALRRTDVALVFQNPADNLIGHLTVGDNLRAAAQAAGRTARVDDLLARLGLPGTAAWRVPALSGGQQQRLAFGCALARGASVVLADEPTSQLDAVSADLVLETLADLARQDVPVVVASHDPRLVALADTRFDLRNGALAA